MKRISSKSFHCDVPFKPLYRAIPFSIFDTLKAFESGKNTTATLTFGFEAQCLRAFLMFAELPISAPAISITFPFHVPSECLCLKVFPGSASSTTACPSSNPMLCILLSYHPFFLSKLWSRCVALSPPLFGLKSTSVYLGSFLSFSNCFFLFFASCILLYVLLDLAMYLALLTVA